MRSRSSSRPLTITSAPSSASSIAVSRPMPEDAPVTSMRRDVRSMGLELINLSQKRRGCGMTLPADALPPENREHGHPENARVGREAHRIHILHVEPELLFPRQGIAPLHLREAGDSRPHLVTPPLEWRVAGQILRQQRPRSDQAHVPFYHVPELRQFIETAGPQEPAEPRQPLRIRQKIAGRIPLVGHTAELQKQARSAPPPDSTLPEYRRTSHPDPDRQRQSTHRGGGRNQQDRPQQPIRGRLYEGSVEHCSFAKNSSTSRTTRYADLPSQPGIAEPFLYRSWRMSSISAFALTKSVPTRVFVPSDNVEGLSVFSLTVRHGIPNHEVSSCMPPESVTTSLALD